MFTTLPTRLKRASRWLPAMLLPFAAQAQVSPYTVGQTSGTYTAITGGTVLGSATSDDEQFNDVATPAGTTAPAPTAGLPVGFTFTLGGTAYDRFAVNNNGWIALGNSSAGATAVTARFAAGNYTPIATATTPPANVIAGFVDDLEGQTGSQLSYSTVGTAPNRTLVVQWTNYRFYQSAGDNFNFQIRLNETANTVVYVYGAFASTSTLADGDRAQVGLRGTTNTDFLTRTTTTTWAASTAGAANNAFMPVASTVIPATGLTYTFTPGVLPVNDAAVTVIYTLGKVSSTYGSPVTVRAVVRNAGSATLTALPVTLTVSGATTVPATIQTVASLAPGATAIVTFPAYAVTGTSGTNTITVTVPADDAATNNSQTYAQTITANDMAYVSGTTSAGGAGVAAANSIIAVKYLSTGPAAVTTVTPTFNGPGAATTTYQVLVYDATGAGGTPGALLYTSPTRNRPVAGGADPVTLPSISVSGAFFVAIKTLVAANIGIVYQNEVPLRGNTFFFTTTNGTTWVDINTQTLTSRLAVDVTLGAPSSCGVVTSLTAGSITGTGATISFTAGAGATGYTVTYTPTGGTATTVTPAPTGSPVVLTGLTNSTTYTVSVTTNCGAGQTSSVATTTFTTLGYCTTGLAGLCGGNDMSAVTITGTTLNATGLTCTTAGGQAYTSYPATGATTATLAAGNTYAVNVTVQPGSSVSVWIDYNRNLLFEASEYTQLTANSATATVTGSVLVPAGAAQGTTRMRIRTRLNNNPNGATDACSSFGSGETKDFTMTIGPAAACPTVGALAAGNITATGATITFTAPAAGTSYTVTYTAAGGTATTVTPAPTASPIVLTGLTANTTYTVSVTTNCGAGQTSTVTSVVFTTAPAPPTYATLPYNESFEGTWVNGANTRDIPTTNWRNTPVTGNASWRRDDDGASANWGSPAAGSVTPAASQGARAARFHSYIAPNNAVGTFDLYANMSAVGTKTLAFDYVNPTGTDRLEILVSTNGGTTFGAPVLTANLNATYAPKLVTIASTSATTVIRFRATSDFGNDDIYIDNLRLTVITGTRNEALAATVSLYPNPAHRAFTLDVPAGALRTATATLHNALGQSVQTRQLSAAGSTTFDVSGLAAGVYSLELKAGDTLVVKRVVVE